MAHQNSLKTTGADFEKAAVDRFRSLAICIPQDCLIYREPWDCSTVLCLNFEACPRLLETTQKQAPLLLAASQQLGLANSVIFKLGSSIKGWMTSQSA